MCTLTTRASASTITVKNTNDSGPGSLRQALAVANNGDTIDATGVSGVITLTSGELLVNTSVTINGPGADVLAVDGNMTSRVFRIVFSDETVAISGFTIRNGNGTVSGGGIDNENLATLSIANCTIIGNGGVELGGGIFNTGMLTIVSTTLSGNSASEGGGIFNSGAGTTMIINTTISGNMAGSGAGSFNIGTFTITNSTLSGNSAVGIAGGILNDGTLQIGDTILNIGASGANISNSGTVTSLGFNLSSDDGAGVLTGPGDQINTDPMLRPLQDNGGPTLTHALLPGSPAINTGDPNFIPPPLFDQRGPGFDRVVNGRIDIGSFEVQSEGTPTPTPTPTATATPTATPTSTITPSPTPVTPTPSPTATPTATATTTPTSTPRVTPTPRSQPTPRPRPTPRLDQRRDYFALLTFDSEPLA